VLAWGWQQGEEVDVAPAGAGSRGSLAGGGIRVSGCPRGTGRPPLAAGCNPCQTDGRGVNGGRPSACGTRQGQLVMGWQVAADGWQVVGKWLAGGWQVALQQADVRLER
jgi:hypothetical protein